MQPQEQPEDTINLFYKNQLTTSYKNDEDEMKAVLIKISSLKIVHGNWFCPIITERRNSNTCSSVTSCTAQLKTYKLCTNTLAERILVTVSSLLYILHVRRAFSRASPSETYFAKLLENTKMTLSCSLTHRRHETSSKQIG